MFRLKREVRFAINDHAHAPPDPHGSNGHAGVPPLGGLGHFFKLNITLSGELNRQTSYVCNIKHIDQQVRDRVVPMMAAAIVSGRFSGNGALVARDAFDMLRNAWPGLALEAIELHLSPFLSLTILAAESPMVRLSQQFEFSASHRLHNPALSDADNRSAFGKCNNVHGHGHNYVLQVTIAGTPDEKGLLIDMPTLEQIVSDHVIDSFDHKYLNVEVEQFRDGLNPSVENIAMVIYRLLKPALAKERSTLASVTVWETPKTSCEYSE